MVRPDISDRLIHFTKGNESLSAYEMLLKILREKCLLGNISQHFKAKQKCVCFTEAPINQLNFGLVNENGIERYSHYGLKFHKKHIFQLGGRPVIYQTNSEFDLLPENIKWRHVRLELSESQQIDFTWEREWRLQTDVLNFSENEVEIILPDENEKQKFISEMERDSFNYAWQLTTVLGELGWMYDSGNSWQTTALKTNLSPE